MESPRRPPVPSGDYALGTHQSRWWLKRFSHRSRFELAIRLLDVKTESHVLDFGSGDGFLLDQLLDVVRSGSLTAFEPFADLREPMIKNFAETSIDVVGEPRDFNGRTFDRIACLEVLEHLQPHDVDEALVTLGQLLSHNGILVISVPVEIGLSVLFKYAAVLIFTRTTRHHSVSDVINAMLGRRVSRDTDTDYLPHKGFDYRELRRNLRDRFRIECEEFSPLPILRGVLNSQVTWRLRL